MIASQSICPSTQVQATICALRLYADWTYTQLHKVFRISIGSLHWIIQRAGNQRNTASQKNRLGRPPVVNAGITQRLIETATASSYHMQLPYTRIAEPVGVRLGPATLKKTFESAGYHRRVARVKPFLSASAKEKRLAWVQRFHDWAER